MQKSQCFVLDIYLLIMNSALLHLYKNALEFRTLLFGGGGGDVT